MSKTSPKRRWLRVSLRTFMIGLTIACLGIGWAVHREKLKRQRRERAREHREATQWVTANRGRITYDLEAYEPNLRLREKPPMPAESVRFSDVRLSDLTLVEKLIGLQSLSLANVFGLDDISSLTKLTHLEQLHLSQSRVSDLSPLENLTSLTTLSITQSREVRDVSPLACLIKLDTLILDGTKVSDIRALATLANLDELNLQHTEVSDIEPLAKLYHLNHLNLYGTDVSDPAPLAGLTNLTRSVGALTHRDQGRDTAQKPTRITSLGFKRYEGK